MEPARDCSDERAVSELKHSLPLQNGKNETIKPRRLSDSHIFDNTSTTTTTAAQSNEDTIDTTTATNITFNTTRVQSHNRRRLSHLSSVPTSRSISQQEFPLGSLAWQQQRQRPHRYPTTPGVAAATAVAAAQQYQPTASPTKSSSQTQEDTFYRNLEIRVHHSVGSMSISPSCRDIVLAG